MRPVDSAYYYIKYRFFKKLFILKLNIQKTTWVDADERMFEACFAVLKQFVEGELGAVKEPYMIGNEVCSHRGFRLHAEGDEIRIDMYLWYRDELPALEKAVSEDSDRHHATRKVAFVKSGSGLGYTMEVTEIGEPYEPLFGHDHVETVKEEKLKELIEMRRHLWI